MDLLKNTESFSSLVGDIYSAAIDRDKWHQVVRRMHHATDGAKVFLFGFDTATGTDLGQISYGYDPFLLKEYDEHYSRLNPYLQGWINARAGVARAGDAFCPRDKLLASEFYHDFLRKDEDATGGGGLPLYKENDRFIGFGGHIPSRFAERNEKDFVAILSLLAPHLTRAFEISRALGGKTLKEHARTKLPERQEDARTEVIVINAACRILYASGSAQRRIELGDIVRADDRSRLHFTDERHDATLQLAAGCLAKGAAVFPVRIDIRNPLIRESFAVQVLPYKGDAATASALGTVCRINEPCLMITIQPQDSEQRLLKRLVSRYGLTLAEAEVAVAIDTEKSLPEIAIERGVSVWTVRSQAKSIFSKLGVSRQAGIVRAVEQERRLL